MLSSQFSIHETFLTEIGNWFFLSTCDTRTRDNLKTCEHTWSTRARNAIYVQTPAGSTGIELLALGGVIWDNHLGHVHTRDCRTWNFRSQVHDENTSQMRTETTIFSRPYIPVATWPWNWRPTKKEAIETCLREIFFRDLHMYIYIRDFYDPRQRYW